MKRLILIVVVVVTMIVVCGFMLCASPIEVDRDVVSVAEIHSGACFGKGDKVDIILIETYNGRYFLGNSWGNKYTLYSNWSDERGGTPKRVAAYLRGQGYKYLGKAK